MPSAAALLRQARTRAGLSQRALARRAGTAQSVIARIEQGITSPTWDTLERLLEAADFEVRAQVEPRVVVGSHMLDDVARILRLTPEQRLEVLAFDCSAPTLARADVWNLITDAGRLDLAFHPAGTAGYDDLAPQAVRYTIYGHEVLAARLEDIIRSKEAAGRPQDRQDVEVMKELLKREGGVEEGLRRAQRRAIGPTDW